jgi:glutamyl-tRNA synthetase
VQVDAWLDFGSSQLVSGGGLEAACASLNDYLAFRTVIVGHSCTLADIACWGQLQGSAQWEKMRKSGSHPHLARWFDFCCGMPALKLATEVHGWHRPGPTAHSAEAGAGCNTTKPNAKTSGSFDIALKNAEMGKVVTRFPPEPSGYLHVGKHGILFCCMDFTLWTNA